MMCKVLIFGCIAAVILMTAAYGAPLTTKLPPANKEQLLKTLLSDLEELKNIKKNFLDFYTPNDISECNQATLQCYLTELGVLIQDMKGEDPRVSTLIKKLSVLQVSGSSKLTCKKCEANEKKKFPEFRQELRSFLQAM
ncbi:IL15 protein, partial [Ptilonorhynchus violaceus]|nr:IL15 protein [Ptilonorhynchus violaceus]